MSWQVGVMSMLALILIGGFAWYERSRPPSQIVALVAALAASHGHEGTPPGTPA